MVLPLYPKQGHDEEINQPGWYKAYFAAFCPGDETQYDFKVADNWNVVSCSKVGGGTHGFCASCAVILIELKHSDFMTCNNSPTIKAGETWTQYYADIRVIDVYDTYSGKIGIKPRGKSETTYNVSEDQTINTSSTDYDITVKNVHYIVKIADNDVMAKTYANIKAQCSGIHLATSVDTSQFNI